MDINGFVFDNRRYGDRGFRFGYDGLFDGLLRSFLVGANKFGFAVDDHLRGVNSAGLKLACVGALSVRKLLRGVRVFPAKIVPVVDMVGECVDVLSGGLCLSRNFFKVFIRARAAAAAFRREQLD